MNQFARYWLARLEKAMTSATNSRASEVQNTFDTRIIWFDGEMTGLEIKDKRLVEVACIITEADLTEVASYGPVVIGQSKQVLDNMSSWCKRTFKSNGLLEKIRQSKVTEEQVEKDLLEFLQSHTPHFKCPLGGNSVNMDRLFIEKYLPSVSSHLHYRTIDVSTIKELAKRWYPDLVAQMPPKKMNHRSLDDIKESIDELKFYRRHLFINGV